MRRISRKLAVLTAAALMLGAGLAGPAEAASTQAGGGCGGGWRQTPSVDMTLVNHTFLELSSPRSHLDHGRWVVQPPSFIGMGRDGCFAVQAAGILTGVQGTVVYSTSAGDVVLYFDNPFWWWNPHVYQCRPPAGYKCEGEPGSAGDEDRAEPVFHLRFNF